MAFDFYHVFKYNPHHDELGLFTTADKGKIFSPDVKSKVGKARHLELARIAALQVHNKASREEPAISKLMQSLVVDPLKLDGFDFRKKELKSLRRKVADDSKFEHKREADAAAAIGDAVRFTVEAPVDQYSRTVTSLLEALKREGQSVTKFKNYWGTSGSETPIYQGVNVQMVTQTGQKWELQFHTAQSFNTKEHLNHKLFEEYREIPPVNRTKAQKHRRIELEREMSANQASVEIPPGVELLHN